MRRSAGARLAVPPGRRRRRALRRSPPGAWRSCASRRRRPRPAPAGLGGGDRRARAAHGHAALGRRARDARHRARPHPPRRDAAPAARQPAVRDRAHRARSAACCRPERRPPAGAARRPASWRSCPSARRARRELADAIAGSRAPGAGRRAARESSRRRDAGERLRRPRPVLDERERHHDYVVLARRRGRPPIGLERRTACAAGRPRLAVVTGARRRRTGAAARAPRRASCDLALWGAPARPAVPSPVAAGAAAARHHFVEPGPRFRPTAQRAARRPRGARSASCSPAAAPAGLAHSACWPRSRRPASRRPHRRLQLRRARRRDLRGRAQPARPARALPPRARPPQPVQRLHGPAPGPAARAQDARSCCAASAAACTSSSSPWTSSA